MNATKKMECIAKIVQTSIFGTLNFPALWPGLTAEQTEKEFLTTTFTILNKFPSEPPFKFRILSILSVASVSLCWNPSRRPGSGWRRLRDRDTRDSKSESGHGVHWQDISVFFAACWRVIHHRIWHLSLPGFSHIAIRPIQPGEIKPCRDPQCLSTRVQLNQQFSTGKHEVLTQCWFNVGPSSQTMAQR